MDGRDGSTCKLLCAQNTLLMFSFMINAVMTFVVAGLGFLFVSLCFLTVFADNKVPDSPGSSRAFWLSAEDNAIARTRMDRVKALPPMVRSTF